MELPRWEGRLPARRLSFKCMRLERLREVASAEKRDFFSPICRLWNLFDCRFRPSLQTDTISRQLLLCNRSRNSEHFEFSWVRSSFSVDVLTVNPWNDGMSHEKHQTSVPKKETISTFRDFVFASFSNLHNIKWGTTDYPYPLETSRVKGKT